MVNNGTGTTLELDESFLHPGIYKSSFMMYCELPPSRQKRSVNTNSPATVYTVTISNNGMDFTEELTIMVFDSSCYSCNTSSLSCEILVSLVGLFRKEIEKKCLKNKQPSKKQTNIRKQKKYNNKIK